MPSCALAHAGAVVDWACAASGEAPTNVLALMLSEGTLPPPPGSTPIPPRSLYLAFNPYDHPVMLVLPPASDGSWHVVCDASNALNVPQPPPDSSYEVSCKNSCQHKCA